MGREVQVHGPLFRRVFFPLCRLLAGILLFFLGPASVRGKYRVPRNGGLLILSNHLADLDPALVQVACPRPIHFMAKSELFEMRVLGPFVRWYKAFPVRRGEPDREALKTAIAYLKAGEAVCVFPEGELSETGELLPLKAGVGLIARMAGVPAICVGIKNTNRALPYGSLIPRPAVRFLEALWGQPRVFNKQVDIETFLAWAEAELKSLTWQEV